MNDTAMIATALAQRLGVEVRPGRLVGSVDGAPVELDLSMRRRDHEDASAVIDLQTGTVRPAYHNLDLAVDATLRFDPPLGAGLAVGPVAGHEGLRSAGRTTFAERFQWKGAEADRAEALLTPDVRAALDAAFVGDPGPAVRDAAVTFGWRRTPWPTVDEIEPAVRAIARAWTLLDAAARSVRPATGTEEAMVLLASFVLPGRLELRGAPSGLVGSVGGVGVAVTCAAPNEAGLHVRVHVRFPDVLPGAPRVVREDRLGWLARLGEALTGRGEVVLGDGRFDRQFAVRTLKPDRLREVLGPEVRQTMLALDALVPIELGAKGIDGHARLPVGRVAAAADAAIALARALG